MSVDVDTRSGFSASLPRELFSGGFAVGFPIRTWDVTPDGERFLVIQPGDSTSSPPKNEIHVILNWFEELRANIGNE